MPTAHERSSHGDDSFIDRHGRIAWAKDYDSILDYSIDYSRTDWAKAGTVIAVVVTEDNGPSHGVATIAGDVVTIPDLTALGDVTVTLTLSTGEIYERTYTWYGVQGSRGRDYGY